MNCSQMKNAPTKAAASNARSIRHTVLKTHIRPNAPSKRLQVCMAAAFLPPQLAEIEEPAAQKMVERMTRVAVPIPSLPTSALETAFVGPGEADRLMHQEKGNTPVVLLHGFDSSCLEFRRLYPLLEQATETWAVDLVGWGFSDHSLFTEQPELRFGPQQKREHLYSFWKQQIGRPIVLSGASLGGAIAIDFALHYPEAVEKLVLISAQGFIDGIGPMANLPRPLAAAGVWVLRTEQLRMAANKMAYHNVDKYATLDAMRVGRLHTHLPGWSDANVAFMRGGGYSISERISQVQQPALVLWGRQDQILEPSYAEQFDKALPNARLHWLEECGHCGHLEQPQEVADLILEFAGVKQPDVSEPAPASAVA